MQVDIFLYQERARLRTELNQLRTIISEKKLIAVEQIAIFENEIIEKQKKIDVVMFYIYKWKNGRFTKSGFFNGKDKKEDEYKKENKI